MSFFNLLGAGLDGYMRFRGQKSAQAHDEKLAQQQANWNRQQSEEEFQRNLEHWHRVNQYNDPSAQMERLKKAGLNPNLVYGGSSGQTAGEASGGSIARRAEGYNRAEARNLMEGQQVFSDFMRFSENMANIKKKEEEVNTEKKKQENIAEDTAMKARTNRMGDEMYDSDKAGRKADNERKEEERDKAKALNDFLAYKYPKEKQIIEQQLEGEKQKVENLIKDGRIKDAMIWYKEKRNQILEETGVDIEKDPLWSKWVAQSIEGLEKFIDSYKPPQLR